MSNAASGSTAELSGGLRHFSGESEDSKEYKRWKLWISNKLLTLDKLTAEARGPYVFTLLTGKALEAVEHLDPSSYHVRMVRRSSSGRWIADFQKKISRMSWPRS